MGEALLRGMLEAGLVDSNQILVAEPFAERRDWLQATYGVAVTDRESELCEKAVILILAVKPQVMSRVLARYQPHVDGRHLVISIAAGVPIAALEKELGREMRIVRVMPNTPALVLAGASALSANEQASEEDMAAAEQIFSAVGTCVRLPEDLLDAVTGLSGSGPGYVFTFMEAMVDGGVLAGLPRPVAEQLVLQTVYGSARLAMETGEPLGVLKGRVTSPGGTTITGIRVMEEAGLRGTVMTAIEAATDRSRDLGS